MSAGKKKRGPRGGMKHQPGRGHNRKSAVERKKKFAKKAARKRKERKETAEQQWEQWDTISDELKRLLGPGAAPKVPRPKNED